MTTLKLTAVGASTGVVIPQEMLARMNVGEGDVLYAVETPDGGYRLTPWIRLSRRRWTRSTTSCSATATRCTSWRNERMDLAR